MPRSRSVVSTAGPARPARPRSGAAAPAGRSRAGPRRPDRRPAGKMGPMPGPDGVQGLVQGLQIGASPQPSGRSTSRSPGTLRNGKLRSPCRESVNTGRIVGKDGGRAIALVHIQVDHQHRSSCPCWRCHSPASAGRPRPHR
jgi:hypothetical protein